MQSCLHIGFAFSYCYWQVSWFWLIHISVMFWGIRYPFHAHKFESTSKMKYLHITTVLLAFIVPWIPVGTIFITGGYTFVRYPPLFCSSRSEGAFFFLHLPLGLLVPIGSTLLTNVLWTICKVAILSLSLISICYYSKHGKNSIQHRKL